MFRQRPTILNKRGLHFCLVKCNGFQISEVRFDLHVTESLRLTHTDKPSPPFPNTNYYRKIFSSFSDETRGPTDAQSIQLCPSYTEHIKAFDYIKTKSPDSSEGKLTTNGCIISAEAVEISSVTSQYARYQASLQR